MGKEKRQNLNFARNMDIDAWRQRQINKRVMLRLAESDQAFKAEHADDTDAELRELVRKKARHLGLMPHPLELPGGRYLASRLGDWRDLSMDLGFSPPRAERGLNAYRRLWQEESERFAEERRAIKAEKREKARQFQNDRGAT